MQPTWLPTHYTNYKKILYRLAIFLIGWPIYGLIYSWGNLGITTVETLKWSWKEAEKSLINGLIGGLIAAIFGGGKACIQHLTLRLILYAHGCIPWNYARFLDYATERIFLQKVGGGYIFIHRLLLEYFAQMEL